MHRLEWGLHMHTEILLVIHHPMLSDTGCKVCLVKLPEVVIKDVSLYQDACWSQCSQSSLCGDECVHECLHCQSLPKVPQDNLNVQLLKTELLKCCSLYALQKESLPKKTLKLGHDQLIW